MKELLMGVDVGTTHIKAALFDIHGKQEALSIRENKAHYEGRDFSYYEPDEIKTIVFNVISDTIKKIDYPFEILGVCASSMAEAGLPIDKNGNPLYHIITWFDQRTVKQAKWWSENMDPYEIFRETGLILHPRSSLNKIMWIKEHKRDIYDKMAYWLCMGDYTRYCLSGSIATDVTTANRTMAMNVNTMQWSDKMLQTSGINKNMLPPIFPSGTVVGRVNKEASEMTLLKEGTPIVTGGHDHLCAALASRVYQEGDIFDSMGTAESLVTIKDSIEIDQNLYKTGFCIGRYVTGNKFYIMGGVSSSGGSVEWFGRNLIEKEPGCSVYEKFNELSLQMRSGPSGIFFIPHIAGSGPPALNPLARGAFIGVRSDHTKADMLKSIYEGVSYEVKLVKDSLEALCSTNVRNFKITGGSTKNQYWMSTKANVLNTDLDIIMVEESAALGAALLAGLAVGVYKNVEDITKTVDISHRVVSCDKSINNRYDYLYENGYKKIYDAINPINIVLNEV